MSMPFATEPPWGAEWVGGSAHERGAALVDLLDLGDAFPFGPRPNGAPPSRERVLAVNQILEVAEIPHAFGGGLAVAYYGEPRVTVDIDVSVFASPDRRPKVKQALDALGEGIPIHPVFSHGAPHEAMQAGVRHVPFAGTTIPIVSPEHLVVQKAILDGPYDWLDIEAILIATEPINFHEIKTWTERLGGGDPHLAKLDELVRRHSRWPTTLRTLAARFPLRRWTRASSTGGIHP